MSEQDTYVAYRLERAHEALDEALLLFENGHYNACSNRLYYACFYAANALLLANNLTAARHSGVLRLFSEHFIRTGLVADEYGKFYHRLFQFRQKSDYEDIFRVDADHVKALLPQARVFVQMLEELINAAEQK